MKAELERDFIEKEKSVQNQNWIIKVSRINMTGKGHKTKLEETAFSEIVLKPVKYSWDLFTTMANTI